MKLTILIEQTEFYGGDFIIIEEGVKDRIVDMLKKGITLAVIASSLSLPLGYVQEVAAKTPEQVQTSKVEQLIDWNKVVESIRQIETSSAKKIDGKYFGDKKHGVYQAYGPLQIHKIVVDDVNRIYHTNYTWNDAHDLSKAIEICKKYLTHYTKNKNFGLNEIAMIWNRGPQGYKSVEPEVIDYGVRFTNLMKSSTNGV